MTDTAWPLPWQHAQATAELGVQGQGQLVFEEWGLEGMEGMLGVRLKVQSWGAGLGCRVGVQGWAEEAWVYPWCAEVWCRCLRSGLNVRKQDYRVWMHSPGALGTALGAWGCKP